MNPIPSSIALLLLGLLAGCASPGMKADGTAMSPADMDRAEAVEAYSAAAAKTRADNNQHQLWHVVLGKHAARQAAGAAAGEAVASAGPVGLNNLMAGAGAIEIGRQAAGVASGTLSNATIGMGLLSGMVYTDADLRHRELAQLRAPYFQVLVIGEPKAGEPIDGTVQRVSERLEALRFRINAVAGCNNAFWRGHRIEGL